jgi:hypothetical protein
MATRYTGAATRLTLAVAAAALSGCAVYGPPYAPYDPGPVVSPYAYYPYGYGRPAYWGPPVSLNFGYYQHNYRGAYGGYRGYGGHGWRGGGGGYGWRPGANGMHRP